MKSALLASVAISFFLINFLNTPTRLDEPYTALMQIDDQFAGDAVLFAGALIAAAPIFGVVSWLKGEKNARPNPASAKQASVPADSGATGADSNPDSNGA